MVPLVAAVLVPITAPVAAAQPIAEAGEAAAAFLGALAYLAAAVAQEDTAKSCSSARSRLFHSPSVLEGLGPEPAVLPMLGAQAALAPSS
jgi:hypothetical protein